MRFDSIGIFPSSSLFLRSEDCFSFPSDILEMEDYGIQNILMVIDRCL